MVAMANGLEESLEQYEKTHDPPNGNQINKYVAEFDPQVVIHIANDFVEAPSLRGCLCISSDTRFRDDDDTVHIDATDALCWRNRAIAT